MAIYVQCVSLFPTCISNKFLRGLPVHSFRNRTELFVSGPDGFCVIRIPRLPIMSFSLRFDDDRDGASSGDGNTNPILMANSIP